VDLIKKENLQDEKVQEYVEVLDRQSARLKKLIEDLMEASKASTGNLTVTLEECDLDVLLSQVIGEFEEKLQKSQLQVIVEKPEHPVPMMMDGRHMWRVLDNLLNNACKYSLPGTRVYVSLKQEMNQVELTFKNISKDALNIPSDALMERFVRGDSSRNTEGSGLGLSIAQSLTELMNGELKLEIDGDLFKVTLCFPITQTK
jgi:signal transduction histidine kinase